MCQPADVCSLHGKCQVVNCECREVHVPTRHSALGTRHSESGIALLIVVSLLTVIGIMGVAFAFSMYLEGKESRQFVSTTQARYIAEAGVAHARVLLDEDKAESHVDDLTEGWAAYGKGNEADTDDDHVRDARWWALSGEGEQPVGRYALAITDAAGKVNLNAPDADATQAKPGAINLTALLERAGFDSARAVLAAQAVIAFRLGPDGKPGVAGVDDDHDGSIDDASEYQPLALRGDDRRFEGLDEVLSMLRLTKEEFGKLAQVATVYSWDLNVSAAGKARVNVNAALASELLDILLDAGVSDPWAAAVNIADAADADLDISRLTKSSQLFLISNQGALGDWTWSESPVGHYEATLSDGRPISWQLSVPNGSFHVLVRGIEGMKVGDVTINNRTYRSVNANESLGVMSLGGELEVRVVNQEPPGSVCAFRGIELASSGAESGSVVRGIEPVRFNEVMAEPVIHLKAADALFSQQGSDWACPLGSSVCANSGTGQGRWTWTLATIRPGRYYVRVYGSAAGQAVGLVTIDGSTPPPLIHGQSHPATLLVGADHKITLVIGKLAREGTYYFQELALSVQPDAEYVELVNLSDTDIDLGGWTIEGELTGGRQARLPTGSVIKAHGLLAACVDLDDEQIGLNHNGISARDAWEMTHSSPVVQLEFPGGSPGIDDDWLKISLSSGSVARLILRRGSSIVDEVEYPPGFSPTTAFQSLEKGDPSVVTDANANGVDDGWWPALKLYTPGLPNDNDGLKETVGTRTLVHDPLKEVRVPNRPLTGIGELAGIPSGEAWKPLSSDTLARIVDRLTVYGYRLEAEGHWAAEGGGSEAWHERAEGDFEHSDPAQAAAAGLWRWTDLVDGQYGLSVSGWPGEQVAVRWQKRDKSWTAYSPALSTDAQGRASVGRITVGLGQTPENTLTLEVLCQSPSSICHVDAIRLDPQLIRVGPVNINTAPRAVLLSLPGMTDDIAGRMIARRPYGNQGGKAYGMGDLLLGDVLGSDEASKLDVFKQLGHLVTTRSPVFEIVSVGQALDGDRPTATQRIKTVVQR